jgi:hypothetical protein
MKSLELIVFFTGTRVKLFFHTKEQFPDFESPKIAVMVLLDNRGNNKRNS